jgi:hypothetical protein
LSKSCQKVGKNCQKAVKMLSKSCKKLSKISQKSCQKVAKNCQKSDLIHLRPIFLFHLFRIPMLQRNIHAQLKEQLLCYAIFCSLYMKSRKKFNPSDATNFMA